MKHFTSSNYIYLNIDSSALKCLNSTLRPFGLGPAYYNFIVFSKLLVNLNLMIAAVYLLTRLAEVQWPESGITSMHESQKF